MTDICFIHPGASREVYSGLGSDLEEAARVAGANFYSVKPVGREHLARTMAMFCGVPQ